MLCSHIAGKKIIAGYTQVLPFGRPIFFEMHHRVVDPNVVLVMSESRPI